LHFTKIFLQTVGMLDTPLKPYPLSDEAIQLKQRMRGIGYARAAGIGLGLFYLAWAPLSFVRWAGSGPTGFFAFEAVFFAVYGILLAMPWGRIESATIWNYCFGVLAVSSFFFTFVMVIDTLFQHTLAAEIGARPAPPAFPGLQIFFGLMQVPAVLFLRRPELLD